MLLLQIEHSLLKWNNISRKQICNKESKMLTYKSNCQLRIKYANLKLNFLAQSESSFFGSNIRIFQIRKQVFDSRIVLFLFYHEIHLQLK